jgi:hypothetical protein
MATQDSILGLFTSPQQYQQALQNEALSQGIKMAQLSPLEAGRAMGYAGAAQIGRGLVGAMGGTDPALQLQSLRTSVLQGVNPNDSASLAKAAQALAQAGDQQGAFQLAQAALNNRNIESQIAGRTEERQAQREMQLQLARERIQANIEIARERGATQVQIAQMMQDGRRQLAQMAAALKSEKAQVADDKAATRIGQNTVFDTLIGEGDTLTKTIDANKDSFSLGGRAATAIKSVMNPSAPSVQAVSDVDSYLKKARNAYLLAAKGTQTEGDAQRAWEEFAGRLDFSSAEGAKRSVERIQKELSTQKQSNEAYLKSRGIQVQGGSTNTSFNSVEEANKANLPKGTIITIGGRRAVVE